MAYYLRNAITAEEKCHRSSDMRSFPRFWRTDTAVSCLASKEPQRLRKVASPQINPPPKLLPHKTQIICPTDNIKRRRTKVHINGRFSLKSHEAQKIVCWVTTQQCEVWLWVTGPKGALLLRLESHFASSDLSLSPAIRIPSGLCSCSRSCHCHKRKITFYSSSGHLCLLQQICMASPDAWLYIQIWA